MGVCAFYEHFSGFGLFSTSQTESQLAQNPLTQTVGRFLAKQNNNKAVSLIKQKFLFLLIALVISGCSGQNFFEPIQTATAKATATKAATATAKPTATKVEPTATKETGYKKITTDNFMEAYKDKSCFIDLEKDVFSGKYKEWRNTQKITNDAFKLNNLAMFRYPNMYPGGAIAFSFSGKPNFDKLPPPMKNFILACTTFQGRNYLLITPEINERDHKVKDPHNVSGEDIIALQVVYPLFNVNTGADLTEDEVKRTIDLLSKMKVIALLTSSVPEWTTKSDSLIEESWKNFPDIQERFKSFGGEVHKFEGYNVNYYEALDDPKLLVLTAIDTDQNGNPDPSSQ